MSILHIIPRIALVLSCALAVSAAQASPATGTIQPKPRYGAIKPVPQQQAAKAYGDKAVLPDTPKAGKPANAAKKRLYKSQTRSEFQKKNGTNANSANGANVIKAPSKAPKAP